MIASTDVIIIFIISYRYCIKINNYILISMFIGTRYFRQVHLFLGF